MTLDPFIASLLDRMKEAGAPALSAGTPAEARALVAAGRAGLGAGPSMAEARSVEIPARGGAVPSLLLVPEGEPRAVLVYLHGGGWVVGSVADYETLGRQLAHEAGCAVLLPDYRLAPEAPFPAALEDSEDVLRWAAEQAPALVGRPAALVVGGDSAGANLATVALRRLRGAVEAQLQVLVYPVVDADFDTPSYREHSDGMPLTRADMEWFFDHYVSSELRASPDVAPLRAEDLEGLPPTLIVTAEHDVLAHEGEAYARKLAAAGIRVTHRRFPGVTHGFIRMHNLFDKAGDAVSVVAEAIRRSTETPHDGAPRDEPGGK